MRDGREASAPRTEASRALRNFSFATTERRTPPSAATARRARRLAIIERRGDERFLDALKLLKVALSGNSAFRPGGNR
jgi:hypothetical protein